MTLNIKYLHKNFGGIKALDGASMKIEEGRITAIIGPNGSGKTTLYNAVMNLIKKDKGQVFLEHKDITKLKDYKIAKAGISRTFQQVRLFKNLTIRDHIEIALEQNDESILKSLFSRKEKKIKKIKKILEIVNLNKPVSTYAQDLSYGQRKLLDLATALAKPHNILLLDEPVAGVNPLLRKQIKEIIKKLNKKGETIVLIEHDMNFVMDLADEIFVMESGKIIAHGKPKDIQNNKKVLDAYLGG